MSEWTSTHTAEAFVSGCVVYELTHALLGRLVKQVTSIIKASVAPSAFDTMIPHVIDEIEVIREKLGQITASIILLSESQYRKPGIFVTCREFSFSAAAACHATDVMLPLEARTPTSFRSLIELS